MESQNVPTAESVKLGFLIRFQVKAGRETEVEEIMKHAVAKVRQEPGTITWFAFRFGGSEFGVIDSFYDEESRQAHWDASSKGIDQLSPFIVEGSVSINKIDIVAAKMNIF